MGKDWDHGVPGMEFWRLALTVAKPGAHLLALGGTRTHHRLMVAIEDAGWEIRDCLMWLYGSGFPKSLDVSKALDKAAGAERKSGYQPNFRNNTHGTGWGGGGTTYSDPPATDLARKWDGWGTALKPAWESIVMARKPLIGTVAANVTRYGTGAINVDGCRIEGEPWQAHDATGLASVKFFTNGDAKVIHKGPHALGRWPPNVILGCACEGETHDADCAAAMLDEMSGERRSSGEYTRRYVGQLNGSASIPIDGMSSQHYADTGGASRFFYTAKASRAERNRGLDGMPEHEQGQRYGNVQDARPHTPPDYEYPRKPTANHHPTVKPLDLMQWLVRLVTPPGGTVLDPFMGSGSTMVAADRAGFDGIGIELSAEYVEIARRRIHGDAPLFAKVGAE